MTSNDLSSEWAPARSSTGPRVGRVIAVLAMCGVGLVGLGACGSSSHTSTGSTGSTGGASGSGASTSSLPSVGANATKVDVCALVSAADMSKLIGGNFTATSGTGGMCNYRSSSAAFFVIVSTLDAVGGWNGALQTLQQNGGATPITVSGVGDQAAYSGTQFDARSGNNVIDVHGADDQGSAPGSWANSIAVAKAVIAKLH